MILDYPVWSFPHSSALAAEELSGPHLLFYDIEPTYPGMVAMLDGVSALVASLVTQSGGGMVDVRALFRGSFVDAVMVGQFMNAVVAEFGSVDALVNNAGISIGGRVLDIGNVECGTVMETSLGGVWYCNRPVVREMSLASGGTIVNVGWMSSFIVNRPRWQPSYLASKAGAYLLTRALAAEWAADGIGVNALTPDLFLVRSTTLQQGSSRRGTSSRHRWNGTACPTSSDLQCSFSQGLYPVS